MNETSKLYQWRVSNNHFSLYLQGNGIDIGSGPDSLNVPNGTVLPFDRDDGDAQYVSSINDNVMDFVYSSHCLEHMSDLNIALFNWTRILKRNGYLYVVVPDYLLYEKLSWPSRFNSDHKHSFSLHYSREQVGRNNHWTLANLVPIFKTLKLNLIEVAVQGYGYDYNRGLDDQTQGTALSQLYFIAQRL